MKMSVALPIIALTLALAAPLAAAHVTKTAGAYTLRVGWASEPSVAQERNQVTLFVYDTASGAGVPALASKLTVSVLHGTASKGLALEESDEAPGNYSSALIPTEPGLYKIRVQGFIGPTQVSSDFDIEAVQDPGDLAFPKQGSSGTGVTMTDLQNEVQLLRTDVDKLKDEQQKQSNKIPSIGAVGAIVLVGVTALALRRRS